MLKDPLDSKKDQKVIPKQSESSVTGLHVLVIFVVFVIVVVLAWWSESIFPAIFMFLVLAFFAYYYFEERLRKDLSRQITEAKEAEDNSKLPSLDLDKPTVTEPCAQPSTAFAVEVFDDQHLPPVTEQTKAYNKQRQYTIEESLCSRGICHPPAWVFR